ncbi:hypothetical protein ACA910_020356 [Epithemia clementina (nom. ined.)]
MTKPSCSLLFLSSACLLASSFLPSTEATTFTFQSIECDSGVVSLSDVSVSCDTETGGCGSGDTVTVIGSGVLTTALPSSYTTSIRLCKYQTWWGTNFMCVYNTELTLDLCESSNAVESSGLECGSAGTYNFDSIQELPSFPDVGSGYTVNAIATIVNDADGSTYESCTLKFATDEDSSSSGAESAASLVWTWSAVGAALLVLGGAVYRKRRVRGRALLDATDAAVDNAMSNESKPSKAPFVEMSDRGGQVV